MNAHASAWAAPLITMGALAVGMYAVAVLDAVAHRAVSGVAPAGSVLTLPFRRASLVLMQHPARAAEHPDAATWALAPALYAGLAAAGLAVVPWSRSFSIADVESGIVLWGTVEALAIVAIFLHGWSANSLQSLLGAYRFLAVGLSYLLLSIFVLIAAAIPAQSLQLSRIVDSQAGVWNVVRQPLGLPLFLVVALGSATWGPLNVADGDDLAGGTAAEVSGRARLLWLGARAAMLTSFSAMAATVFLGGWHGPVLPGPVWVAVKTLVVLIALVGSGHVVARVRAERFVTVCWVVLLPLAFADLAIAGLEALR